MELDSRDHPDPETPDAIRHAVGAGLLVVLLVLAGCLCAAGCRTGVSVVIRDSPHSLVRFDGSQMDTQQGKSVPIDVARGAQASWGRAAGTAAGAAIGAAVGGPGGAATGAAVGGPIIYAVDRVIDDPTRGVQIDLVPEVSDPGAGYPPGGG